MHSVSVLDRYTNKYLEIGGISAEDFATIQANDKLVYGLPDPKTGVLKESIGTMITNKPFKGCEKIYGKEECKEAQKISGNFKRKLIEKELQDFEEQQHIALKIFPSFKKEFKAAFPGSVPITARFQIFSNQLYFFFYSEERYIFTEFVRKFREKLGMNMFLFQVGARDMMRMSPGSDNMCGSCGQKLCCKTNMILPNIEIEAVIMQNLEGRDIEKLKGKCGKLKCCLLYELELYIEENKKYPKKGTKIDITNFRASCKDDECKDKEACMGTVASFNIITQEINIKTKEGFLRIPIDKFKTK